MIEPAGGPAAATEREARRHLRALRRYAGLIAAVSLAAVAAAVLFVAAVEERYRAEASVLVSPLRESDDLAQVGGLTDPGTSVFRVGRFIETPQLADDARRHLGPRAPSRRELMQSIEVRPVPQSGTVAVLATAPTSLEAARIANAYVDALILRRSAEFQSRLSAMIQRVRARAQQSRRINPRSTETATLEARLADLSLFLGAGDPSLRVLSRAVPPEEATWPRPLLSVLAALVAGLLGGVGAALTLEALNPRVEGEDEVLELMPILTRLPRAGGRTAHRYLRGGRLLPAECWEAYRTLRANLAGPAPVRPGLGSHDARSILITSAIGREGKTMASVNLAVAFAAAGARVVLVDGDFRRPRVGEVFGVDSQTSGFSKLLTQETTVEEALVTVPSHEDRLRLLLPGPHGPIDLLEPSWVQSVLAMVKQTADVVVVDSPALTEFADALAFADAADIVVVAARLGRTRRDKLVDLTRFLDQHGISPAGCVLTVRRRARGPRQAPPRGEPRQTFERDTPLVRHPFPKVGRQPG